MSCSLPILSIFTKRPSYWLFRKNLLVRPGILSATALSKPIIKCLGDGGRATFNLDPAFGSLETRGCKLDHRLYCTRRQVFNPVDCFLKVEISISYLKLTTFFVKVLNPSFGLLAIRKHEQPWAAFLHCDGQWWPERAHPPSTRCVDAASPAACTQLRYLPVQAGPAVIRPSEDTLRASVVPDARDSKLYADSRSGRSEPPCRSSPEGSRGCAQRQPSGWSPSLPTWARSPQNQAGVSSPISWDVLLKSRTSLHIPFDFRVVVIGLMQIMRNKRPTLPAQFLAPQTLALTCVLSSLSALTFRQEVKQWWELARLLG